MKTITRLVAVLRYARGTAVSTIEQDVLAAIAANALPTGLCLVVNGLALLITEQSFEATVHMIRALHSKASAEQGRVVASIEDCPARLFGTLTVKGVSGSAESGAGAPTGAPHVVAISLYKQLVSLSHKLASDSSASHGHGHAARDEEEAGGLGGGGGGGGGHGRVHPETLEGLERYLPLVPLLSEAKLTFLVSTPTSSSGLPALAEWLALYGRAVDFDAGDMDALPLPPRVPY